MQGLKWKDFSGIDGEVPAGWHAETQMALEELNKWESEEITKRARRRK